MASFRKSLEDQITLVLKAKLDVNTGADHTITTWDNFLHDVPKDDLPYLVVTARQKTQSGPGEFGTLKELFQWEVIMYYLDIADEYAEGEERRDKIVDDITTTLEQNYRINNLSVPINHLGNIESVYDSNFSSVLFDSSGQDSYYTFTSEMYLMVDTQRN